MSSSSKSSVFLILFTCFCFGCIALVSGMPARDEEAEKVTESPIDSSTATNSTEQADGMFMNAYKTVGAYLNRFGQWIRKMPSRVRNWYRGPSVSVETPLNVAETAANATESMTIASMSISTSSEVSVENLDNGQTATTVGKGEFGENAIEENTIEVMAEPTTETTDWFYTNLLINN